ncbi:hypothetical protein KPH14_009650 [Odynerus spinipes]|uniref:CLIP domain-containing serine protease n=1 Tax=Odynerus spinipes TaxID=1348599 RepID=A0AAD9RPW2_9HYME|nr:hypothetical protein KPH14_009650 [Odynerus spinipes]
MYTIALATFAILLLSFGGTDAQDRCLTPLNKNGICINIKNCEELINILKISRPLPQVLLDFLRDSQCGFEGTTPKVCCQTRTTSPPVNVTTAAPIVETVLDPPDVSNHPNLRLLHHDICGPITERRIIGGNKTGVFDFPWMALIAYNVGQRTPEFRCGGSLVNKRYVLTAAHCVTSLPAGLTLVGVRVGDHDISTERDCDKDEYGLEVSCAEKYQDFGIDSVHFHPEYSKTKLQNDIALIRLNGDVDLTPRNVKPICLPTGPSEPLPKKVVVTGWGATELGPRSQDLLMVFLSPVSNEECKEVYKRNIEIWYKQLCAGGKKLSDSCLGDSGGPLQAPGTYNSNLRYIQYGIVSFGLRSCGTEGFPGVYTNVKYYMDWILNTMRD